jgi:HK97 family phage major capsid protein
MELKLKKLMAIGYATDELLADASALESVMTSAFVEELTFKVEDAIINGTGAGQPLGILNSGALVTVTPESGQAAATLRTENILNMWARTPIRSRRSLIWICNQDIEPQLWQLTDLDTATVQMYTLPGQNGGSSPYGLLMGRPVLPIEYSATLGTVGDLMLIDPMQYVMIDKNGVQQASSLHVRFLQDEMTFRFTLRVDGQPVWRSPVTPYKGTGNTLSPFVALGTR